MTSSVEWDKNYSFGKIIKQSKCSIIRNRSFLDSRQKFTCPVKPNHPYIQAFVVFLRGYIFTHILSGMCLEIKIKVLDVVLSRKIQHIFNPACEHEATVILDRLVDWCYKN